MTPKPWEFFVVCQPGLEPALEAECRHLDPQARALPGGVTLEGPSPLAWEANLRLRTAGRVLQRILDVPVSNDAAVEKALRDVPWRDWTQGKAGGLSLHASGFGGRPVETLFQRVTQLKVAPRKADHGQAESDEATLGVWARLSSGRLSCAIDTSGALLYRRGYRQEISRAPLRETLAAGLLLLAGYDGSEPLWDPFCGSGTFVIEAAWLAMRRAPGLGRAFAFQNFRHFDAQAYAALQSRIEAERLPKPAFGLGGSDIHAGALGTARRNARRGQVLDQISLQRQDVLTLKAPPGPPGLLVANLPYGIRVGERDELRAFYRKFGERLRSGFQGWRTAVLVCDPQFEQLSGLPVQTIHAVSNGGIPTRWIVSQRIA